MATTTQVYPAIAANLTPWQNQGVLTNGEAEGGYEVVFGQPSIDRFLKLEILDIPEVPDTPTCQ
jgi:hypothetical protein